MDEHNVYRCEVGLEPLAWDCQLAAVAQKLADGLGKAQQCEMHHSERSTLTKAFKSVGYPEHAGAMSGAASPCTRARAREPTDA